MWIFFSDSNRISPNRKGSWDLPSRCYSESAFIYSFICSIHTICSKEKSRPKGMGMDFLTILTPVNSHYFIALEALEVSLNLV